MNCLKRNQSEFYYALYEGRFPVLNDSGRPTGEYEIRYGNPIQDYANISAARGEASTQQFGESLDYDKIITISDTDIDEFSILWVDTMPALDENGALALDDNGETLTPHDYVVTKRAASLNNVAIAIRKVNVSG